jgi:hypothetical protein
MLREDAKRCCASVSGVSNIAYDALTILQNKLKGIAAMEEYKLDVRDSTDVEAQRLFDELERREVEDVTKLKAFVATRL